MDPIADEFAWVNTYNYAENEPVAHIDLHGLQKYRADMKESNSFLQHLKNLLHNLMEGTKTVMIEFGDATGISSLFEQGSPNTEDFHDHGSVGGGIQAFSPEGNLNGEGTAPTAAAAEEGTEVSILLLEGMFPPGGGSGGMGNDAIERIDNFINSYDNAKQVREKLKEQNREPQEKPKIKWSDGKTTIYEKYRPDEK